MKIFISHSIKDINLINAIKQILEPYGITLFIAEHYLNLVGNVTQKIQYMIDNCDLALVVLTEHGFNSNFVQQEIGFIHRANKPSINLVEKGLETMLTGFIYGNDMILFDPKNPYPELNKTRNILLNHWERIQQEVFFKKLEEQQKNNAKAVFGFLAGIFILGAILDESNNKQ